jgi:hypothetical protein
MLEYSVLLFLWFFRQSFSVFWQNRVLLCGCVSVFFFSLSCWNHNFIGVLIIPFYFELKLILVV